MKDWYFLHIPKTAGTSTIRALSGWRTCPARDWVQLRGLPWWRVKWSRGFAGHFGVDLPAYLGRRLWTFTFLREPEAMVLSAYGHVLRDATHPLHGEARRRDLAGFLRDFRVLRDPQVRWLNRRLDVGRMREARGAAAVAGLVREAVAATEAALDGDRAALLEGALAMVQGLDYVGLTETWEADMGVLGGLLGRRLETGTARLNVNAGRLRPETLTEEERDLLHEATRLDRALYASVARGRGKESTG